MNNIERAGDQLEPENLVHKGIIFPPTRQSTVKRALREIILDRENFINSTIEKLETYNSNWAGRLRNASLSEPAGQNNYMLFSSLAIFCAMEEFEMAGRAFPVISLQTDAASQAEMLKVSGYEEEKITLRQSVTEFMQYLQNQDPNLFHIIIYLHQALGVASPAGMLGVYHARKSLINQLEADYWQRKIEV